MKRACGVRSFGRATRQFAVKQMGRIYGTTRRLIKPAVRKYRRIISRRPPPRYNRFSGRYMQKPSSVLRFLNTYV